jgi:energy-coupling factor transport system ATP-binding protein
LEIKEQEITAIIGRNGSGKTTLAKLLNGIYIPDQGSIMVDGLSTSSPENLWLIRQKVGLLFAEADKQIIAATVEEDVAFGPENLGLTQNQIRLRVDNALKLLSMEEFAKHPPYLLSGGQKRKVGIAGLLAMQPSYLVLDEPVSMLDDQSRQEVLEALWKLKQQAGVAIVIITHNLESILQADRVILLDSGQVKLQFTPDTLFYEVDKLKSMQLEPLEISIIIQSFNRRYPGLIPREVRNLNQLVEILCQLKLKKQNTAINGGN